MYRNFLKTTLVIIILLCVIFTNNIYAAASIPPDISAKSAILVDAERGQILFQKEPSRQLRASIASKIMTILLAVEKGKLDTKVTISKESISSEGSNVNLIVGEKYTIEDLLFITMLTYSNDAANAIAESISGDVNKFVNSMNEKAKGLNMRDTHFDNPSGLDSKDQFTTAQDIAVLMRYALGNPLFNNIFSTSARPWTAKSGTQILVNQNKLFWWGYEGVKGGKVGYGENSNLSAITTVSRENQDLICIVLDAKQDAVFNDSVRILDYGFENYRKGTLVNKGRVLTTAKIEGYDLELSSMEDVYYTFPIGDSYIKNVEFNVRKDLKPPITPDVILGSARYLLSDGTIVDVNLHTTKEISQYSNLISLFNKRLGENKDIFYVLVVLSILEIILILVNLWKFIKKRIFG